MNNNTKNLLFTGGKMAMNLGLGALAPLTGGATIPIMIGANAAMKTAEVLSDEEKKKKYGFKSLVSDVTDLGIDAATAGIGGSALKPLAKTALNTGLNTAGSIGSNILAGNDRLDQQTGALFSIPGNAIQEYGKYVAKDGIIIEEPPYKERSMLAQETLPINYTDIYFKNNGNLKENNGNLNGNNLMPSKVPLITPQAQTQTIVPNNTSYTKDGLVMGNEIPYEQIPYSNYKLQFPQLDLVLKPKSAGKINIFKDVEIQGGKNYLIPDPEITTDKQTITTGKEITGLKSPYGKDLNPYGKSLTFDVPEESTPVKNIMNDYEKNLARAERYKTYEAIGKGALLSGMMLNSLLRKPSEKLVHTPTVAPRLASPSTAMKAEGERIIDTTNAATMESIKRAGGTYDMYAGVSTAKQNALKDLGIKSAMADTEIINKQAELDMGVDAQNKQGALTVSEANIKSQQAENATIAQERANLIGNMFNTATDYGTFKLGMNQKKIDYTYLQKLRAQMGDEAFFKWWGDIQMQNKFNLATPVAEKS